jgi:hypothetical protein
MAHEIRTDLTLHGQEATQADGITASFLARKLQTIGQHILSKDRLVEVEENVFSTCQDPIEEFADRLLRARDTGVPLVEATLFPQTDRYAAIRQAFGATRGLVRGIIRSDGFERDDSRRGKHIKYEGVDLPTDRNFDIVLGGDTGSEVEASRSSTTFSIESGRVSESCAHEHGLGYGLVPSDRSGINLTLDRILEDFDIAIMRDGSIEGSAVDEIPEDRQIGNLSF